MLQLYFICLIFNPIDYTYLKTTVENLKKMVLNGYLWMRFQWLHLLLIKIKAWLSFELEKNSFFNVDGN